MPKKGEEAWTAAIRPVLAEFVGSVFFIFIACGAAMSTAEKFTLPGTITLGVAFAFGFTLFALAFTIGHISGGHLNSALTLAFVITGKISPTRGFFYFLAQLTGGLVGGSLLLALLPVHFRQANCFASNVLADGVTPAMGFFIEVFLTAFLLLVVGAAVDTAKSNRTLVPLAIGMAVFVCHLIAIPVTGTSLNPTRSFASAAASHYAQGGICSHVWDDHWIFWVGPCIGAILGLYTYEFCLAEKSGAGQNLVKMYRRQTQKTARAEPAPAVELGVREEAKEKADGAEDGEEAE